MGGAKCTTPFTQYLNTPRYRYEVRNSTTYREFLSLTQTHTTPAEKLSLTQTHTTERETDPV